MSVNVNVCANPINIHRGKMVLSDFDSIKKCERDHRRRLRKEQVHEQSKAFSKKVLEKTKQVEKEQLRHLEHNDESELKRAHKEKLMSLLKYQDIENIGCAHENAAKQPDQDYIRQIEEKQYRELAKARGAQAMQRLQETQVVSPHKKQQGRLRQVREFENKRSSMVARLPKKTCTIDGLQGLSESENIPKPSTSTKKSMKCFVSKKSPIKSVTKSQKTHSKSTKSPRISVSIEDQNQDDDLDKTLTEETACTDKSKKLSPSKLSNNPETVSDFIQQTSKMGNVCESDDNEPRKLIPRTSSVSDKPDTFNKYTSYHNICDLSSTSATSTSSISDDSSYFSDTATAIRKTPKHHTSPASSKASSKSPSKVSLYDHSTHQRNLYTRPSGLVEKLNIKNVASADDLAKKIVERERIRSNTLANQKEHVNQCTQYAMLREKIRKDYGALVKNLDLLSQKERKLKANQIQHREPIQAPSKKSKNLEDKHKRMDRAFQDILRSSRRQHNNLIERPITITPRDYIHSKQTPTNEWKESHYINNDQESEISYSEDENDYTEKRQISKLLIKIEKLKRILLQEYGADLPDEIFNASVKSFTDRPNSSTSTQKRIECVLSKPEAPEVRVINMSGTEESKLVPIKPFIKNKKVVNAKVSTRRGVNMCNQGTITTRDQQVQVKLVDQNHDTTKEIKKRHPLEPVVKIVNPKNADSSSTTNSSSATDVVVDVSKKEITVVPKDSSIKISKNVSQTSSVKSTRTMSTKTPVKISFDKSDGSFQVGGLLIDPAKQEITVLPKRKKAHERELSKISPITDVKSQSVPGSRLNSPSKRLSRSAPPSRHSSPKKPPATSYREQFTQVSVDSSTESSAINCYNSETHRNGKSFTRHIRARRIVTSFHESSDTSTTYASPPTVQPGEYLKALNRDYNLLDLLDPAKEISLRQALQQVSSASSPETLLPMTTNISSNIPKSGIVYKKLNLLSLIDAQARVDKRITKGTLDKRDSKRQVCKCRNPACKLVHEKLREAEDLTLKHCPEIFKKYEALQNDCSERIASLTNLIERVRNEQIGLELSMTTNDESNSTSQIIAKGKSAIVTDQSASVTGQSASVTARTAASISAQSTARSKDISKLVANIEAFHAQLKKTLFESQQIISGQSFELPPPIIIEQPPLFNVSKDSTINSSQHDENDDKLNIGEAASTSTAKTNIVKPKVMTDEKVHIRLNRFRLAHNSKSVDTQVDAATAAQDETDKNEDMVMQLSKEILEQSKSITKSEHVDSIKDSDDSILKSSQAHVNNEEETSKNATMASDEHDQSANQSIDLEQLNDSNFIPLLAGIPKITRPQNSTQNCRTRPPVTLISGPYRPEIASPVHELSTIVEFDTPETVNKSQISTRSPSNRCRKRLPTTTTDTARSTASSPSKKTEIKSVESKPSAQVAPLPAHQSPKAFNVCNKSTKSIKKSPKKSLEKYPKKSSEKSPKKNLEKSPKKNLEKSPKKNLEKSTKKNLEKSPKKNLEKSPKKNLNIYSKKSLDKTPKKNLERPHDLIEYTKLSISGTKKFESSDSMHTLPDVHIEELHESQDNGDGNYLRISQISELQSLPDENIDQMLIGEFVEDTKSKTTTPLGKLEREKQEGQSQGLAIFASSRSLSAMSGASQITNTPSSDLNILKGSSSPEGMELELKKLGLSWAASTLKKTREASALGSSSSSDVTPVNTAARLVSPVKKHHDASPHDLPEVSDVSSISIKNANKSTDKSVLVRGRTSTPNRYLMESNSDGTISTLDSFASDLNIVVQDQSAEITLPNISISKQLG